MEPGLTPPLPPDGIVLRPSVHSTAAAQPAPEPIRHLYVTLASPCSPSPLA